MTIARWQEEKISLKSLKEQSCIMLDVPQKHQAANMSPELRAEGAGMEREGSTAAACCCMSHRATDACRVEQCGVCQTAWERNRFSVFDAPHISIPIVFQLFCYSTRRGRDGM